MQTEESIMRHALGLSERNGTPYRNHYAYDPASTSGVLIKKMIDKGLMVHAQDRKLDQEHGLNNAHVTMEGWMSLTDAEPAALPGLVTINGAEVPTFDV